MTGTPTGFQRPPTAVAPPPSQTGYAAVPSRSMRTRADASDWQPVLDVEQDAFDLARPEICGGNLDRRAVTRQRMLFAEPGPRFVVAAKRLQRQRCHPRQTFSALTGA